MIEQQVSSDLHPTGGEIRRLAMDFISMMKQRVGNNHLKTYENDNGIGMLFNQRVLLCSAIRPQCLKTVLCLWISDDDNQFAEIVPWHTFKFSADLDYVEDICSINRRIFSKEGVVQCGWDSLDDANSNLKRVSIYYMYRGLYDIKKLIKNPRLVTLHMRDLKNDLTVYYSMLYNQFRAREEHFIGGSIMDAPISSKTYAPNECDSCKDCRFWEY